MSVRRMTYVTKIPVLFDPPTYLEIKDVSQTVIDIRFYSPHTGHQLDEKKY
jgi:hypothetical protein